MKETAKYMTVEEAAEIWKVRPERIIYTCECGGIDGAAILSGQWIIPTEISKPVIKQMPISSDKLPDENNKRTNKQQALVNAFKDDAIPFSVSEHQIGKKTFIVTSCYQKNATQTLSEIMFSLISRDFGLSVSEHNKILKQIRQEQIDNQLSYSEYMENVKAMLIQMEFCEEDMAMLLDKYAEAYQPLK
jgi:hypothetical protein